LGRLRLYAARHAVCISGPSAERRSLVPRGGGALDCVSRCSEERACSPESSAYCQARKRLPEKFFSQLAKQMGQQLDTNAKSNWLWKNRQVYIFDGATVSMPDSLENQEAPQPPQQKPGLGFPLMRIAVVSSHWSIRGERAE
jgi:hypothetical protein